MHKTGKKWGTVRRFFGIYAKDKQPCFQVVSNPYRKYSHKGNKFSLFTVYACGYAYDCT